MNKKLIALLVGTSLGLAGCNSSSDKKDDVEPSEPINAVFNDIGVPVYGVNYQCDSGDKGTTNTQGQFKVEEGAICQFDLNDFKIGHNLLPITAVNTEVSGLTLGYEAPQRKLKSSDNPLRFAANLSALLQTISSVSEETDNLDVSGVQGETINEEILFVEDDDAFEELVREVEIIIDDETIVIGDEIDEGRIDVTPPSEAEDDIKDEIEGTYHSDNVARVLAHLQAILTGDTTVTDIQHELDAIRSDLETADNSNGHHQAALRALLEIAEVVNEDEVAQRIVVTGSDYTEMLAQLLDQSAAVDMVTKPQGTTEDVAHLLHEAALRLINASEKLALALPSPAFDINYDGASLSYSESLEIRTAALAAANVLSTLASYDVASDEYYLPLEAQLNNVEVVIRDQDGNWKEVTQDFNVEYYRVDSHQLEYFNDDQLFTHRRDAKYLTVAKQALTQAVKTALLLELAEEDQALLADVAAHLEDENSVFKLEEDGETVYLDLHAFYNASTSIDRNDFIIEASYECDTYDLTGGASYNEVFSMIKGDTICKHDDALNNDHTDWYKLMSVGYDADLEQEVFIKAVYADLMRDIKEAANSNLTNVLWCGYDDNDNRLSCLDD